MECKVKALGCKTMCRGEGQGNSVGNISLLFSSSKLVRYVGEIVSETFG